MYFYDFEIAGLLFRVNSQFPLAELYELTNFQCNYLPRRQPDVEYTLQMLAVDWKIKGTPILEDRQNAIYYWQNEEHRYYFWNIYSKAAYVLVRHQLDDPAHYSICLQPDSLELLLPKFRLSAFLSPEPVLLQHNAFFLHASVLDWQGRGILFTAPSGTGKSTQASLWHRLEGAHILNGDRAIIRLHEGQFTAYGSPYAGTSGIYINHSVPISAVVTLSQAPANSLAQLSPLSAFQRIYRECTVCAWDTGFADKFSDLLSALIDSIPVYHLACRPDEGAVTILKEALNT